MFLFLLNFFRCGALSMTPKSVFGELFGDDEMSGSDDLVPSPSSMMRGQSQIPFTWSPFTQ